MKTYSVKQFAEVSDHAARIQETLEKVKDPVARAETRQLADAHDRVRACRHQIDAVAEKLVAVAAKFNDVKQRLKVAVTGAIFFGQAFKLDNVADFAVERSTDIISAERLETLFSAHGVLGEEVRKQLNTLGNEYRRVVDDQKDGEALLETLARNYATEMFNLQSSIATGKAVLQRNHVPIPKLARATRNAKKKSPKAAPTTPRSTADEAAPPMSLAVA